MYYPTLFSRPQNRPVRACLMGAGKFGHSFIFQSQYTPHLIVPAVCTRTVQRAMDAYADAGVPAERVRICETPEDARKAYADGFFVVATRFEVIADLPMDVLVESSGVPEVSAAAAELAVIRGMHVVMVSKATDSVVGPILAHKAAERGRVYTCVDGDQPSLLIGLISWAQSLGLNIVCAGKASDEEHIYDTAQNTLTCSKTNTTVPAGDMAALWAMGERSAQDVTAARGALVRPDDHRNMTDLLEMQLVANATGLLPDTPRLHAPLARILELPDIFCPRADGGLVEEAGRLDVFHCLRRPDEAGMAGGVFIVVECKDTQLWKVLRTKGHICSRNGKYAVIYRPSHLLGAESALSVLAAVILNHATSGDNLTARCDMCARTVQDLPEGLLLRTGSALPMEGIQAMLSPALYLNSGSPLPYYMLNHLKLKRPVAAGKFICAGDVDLPPHSTLLRLRRQQDELSFI